VTGLRWAVRAVLAFGLAASILANILHAQRNPVSMIIAGVTPVCLFLALALVTRLPVQRSALARGRWVATIGIAGIAAYVSYWHMVGVALKYGEPPVAAYLLPLAIDGLIVVATINLFELARTPQPGPPTRKPKPVPETTHSAEPPKPFQPKPIPTGMPVSDLVAMKGPERVRFAWEHTEYRGAAGIMRWLAEQGAPVSKTVAYDEVRTLRTATNGDARDDH
jgi:hypothetical protein